MQLILRHCDHHARCMSGDRLTQKKTAGESEMESLMETAPTMSWVLQLQQTNVQLGMSEKVEVAG